MKSLYSYVMLLGMTGAFLTSCSNEDLVADMTGESGKTIHMVVSAVRDNGADADSRTSLTESDGALSCVWTAGDRILVTDENGKKLGKLTIKAADAGKKEAEFSGDLTGVSNGTPTLNYYYLGTSVSVGDDAYNGETVPSKGNYVADFSNQHGTLESLSDYDILSVSQATVINGTASYYGKIKFDRHISFARFKMNFPEGVEVAYPVTVTMTGNELRNKATITLADRKDAFAKGTVTINDVEGQEFYMTYLPTEAADEVSFTAVDKNGKSFVGKYDISKAVGKNKYFRKALGNGEFEGINVDFTPVISGYTVNYVTDDNRTIISENHPESEGDIVWNVKEQGPENIEGLEELYAPEGMEFDRWKMIYPEVEGDAQYPETVTLSKETPSYTFIPTWKEKTKYTWTITWKSDMMGQVVKTQTVESYDPTCTADITHPSDNIEWGVTLTKDEKDGRFNGWWYNGDNITDATTLELTTANMNPVITAKFNYWYIIYHYAATEGNNKELNHDHILIDTQNSLDYKDSEKRWLKWVEPLDYTGYNHFKSASDSQPYYEAGKVFDHWAEIDASTGPDYVFTGRVPDSTVSGKNGVYWAYPDGVNIVHLKAVYKDATVSTPGYGNGTFND